MNEIQKIYSNLISDLIELPVDRLDENSVRLDSVNATYYYNLTNCNYCVIVSDDGSYLLTSSDAVRFEKLLFLFKTGNRNGKFELDNNYIYDEIENYSEIIDQEEIEIIEEDHDIEYEIITNDNVVIKTMFSSSLGKLEKINEKSYKIGNMFILLSTCPNEYELNVYASNWLNNNEYEIIYEKNRDYKIGDYRVIEKQVRSANVIRVFKFICIKKVMLAFTYGSIFSSYSEVADKAIKDLKTE